MATNLTELIDEDASQRTLAPVAVGSQIALMSVVSAVTIIVFNILRPRNKIVYEPKVKYHVGDKRPPRISDSLLGWLPPLIHTKEPVLVEKIGLDAAIFLRFLRMFRYLFTAIAFICCALLIPVDVSYNLRHIPSESRDVLSMMTIRDVSGNLLFVHVAVTYVITGLVMGFVWINWREVLRLRQAWFRSPEYMQSFYARTLMITEVPRQLQSDEGLRAIFQSVQVPYPTTSVHIGRRVGKLAELIEFHNNTVRELEHVLVRYLKDGNIGKQRPQIRLGGFVCFGGQKVDAIDYYTAKLRRCEEAVENCRNEIATRRAESYGFASMAAVPYAHIVARLLKDKHPKGTTITLAPNPKDIVWSNLSMSKAELMRNQTFGWSFLVLVCSVNTVPLLIISILANLASLTSYVPFLDRWSEASPGTFTFISGVLPPAVSAAFGYALPIIMRWLTKYMGAHTHSRLDRAVIARYFAFLVISQLIIFTLIGVIFNSVTAIVEQVGKHESIGEIVENLHTLPSTINRTYIDQASYWLTYFPLRGFLVLFDLAQIIHLVIVFVKKHLFGRTPRDIREWTQPPDFQYAIYYSNLLFMGTVGLFFAPLAPLVAVAAMVVFWLSSWVYKYQLMFVFVTRVETGGRLWNVIVNRLLVSTVIGQLLMVLTIGLQYEFQSFFWLSTVPPILFILAFKVYIDRNFLSNFRYYIPSEDELRQAHIYSKRADAAGNKLEKRFGHPALHAELFTPMVHANMTHLLSEVFNGKIGRTKTKLDDLGGSKVDAVVADGVKIAGIEERDLEYDPALYQRDRGELDWDQRSMSMSSVNLLAGDKNVSKAELFAASGRASPAPSQKMAYDKYLANGAQPEIEMARLDYDEQPLLPTVEAPGYSDPSDARSIYSNPHSYSPMQEAPSVPSLAAGYRSDDGHREAPVHRPHPAGQDYWR
ncbi:DUF221-domain-containing protein [Laetiporus sulphureus 93-53]|uniref:DUF221-domain-containing protein n=1 Tax=Laetiporus sulphureus 93-53 TaxID=1314785 RepID=A0A165DQ98_9APHY|nr:DUF221-domain-containing protein [Laetiporus sulphureus 93-53]KZT05389.1 DUF221-domain-containing protein [Laetiporus sulphureus 93-53]